MTNSKCTSAEIDKMMDDHLVETKSPFTKEQAFGIGFYMMSSKKREELADEIKTIEIANDISFNSGLLHTGNVYSTWVEKTFPGQMVSKDDIPRVVRREFVEFLCGVSQNRTWSIEYTLLIGKLTLSARIQQILKSVIDDPCWTALYPSEFSASHYDSDELPDLIEVVDK